jgi:hypothetical protein
MPFVSQVLGRVVLDNSTAGLVRRLGLEWLACSFGGAPSTVHATQPEAYLLRGEVCHAVRDSRF